MKEPANTTRDIARELARKYSTMTHEELDLLESILVPIKFNKNQPILKEGEICDSIYYVDKGLIRQFYFKNGKEVTEHLGENHTIFMCIESLFKEEPTKLRLSTHSPRSVWKAWRSTMSTYRFYIERFLKRALFFHRCMPTWFDLKPRKTDIGKCASSCRKSCSGPPWSTSQVICR